VLKNPSGFRSATLWIDPLQTEQWKVLALTNDFDLVSLSLESTTTHRSSMTLWDGSPFGSNERIWWHDNGAVATHELDGLSCLVARRQAARGEGVHFLDPVSLAEVRQPLFIRGFVGDMIIACARWLVVVFLQRGHDTLPRLAVWDLRAMVEKPVAEYFTCNGDVYYPIVTNQTETAFEMMFVLRPFTPGAKNQLCRFRWPTGIVEELEEYNDLRMIRID
jgi:hypothetical protein